MLFDIVLYWWFNFFLDFDVENCCEWFCWEFLCDNVLLFLLFWVIVIFCNWMRELYVLFFFNRVVWLFILIIFFFCIIVIMFVFWIVERWWVIIIVVWFIIILFRVFCMICFEFVFSVFVVLFRRRMVGFFRIVWVMVIFCFWFFDICILCLFIWVL